ncbi:MAG: hypothetical protein K2O14_11890 [Oscillospiraceae bacterium]|nr:hypothetical protein [Oscillospiraceae bacterium]
MNMEIEELNEVTETAEGENVGDGAESAPDAEKRIAELTAQLAEVTIRLELLMAGADKERLEEGSRLAAGLCGAGKAPADAAAEIVAEYPHLRAVRREIPQLSAQGGGRDDGFAAIRSIFAKK